MENSNKLSKKLNEYTKQVTPGQLAKIGPEEVRHLYQVYLGREPGEQEIKIYENHPDSKQLMKDLSMQRKDKKENLESAYNNPMNNPPMPDAGGGPYG